jgi:hypothetical protein
VKRAIILLVVLGAVLCIGFFAITIGGAFLLTQPVTAVGEGFFNDLKAQNYEAAYGRLSDDLKKEVGSVENFGSRLSENDVVPTSWNIASRNIDQRDGSLSGTLTTASNATMNFSLSLENVGGSWLINGFDFSPA